jgi:hypothetical protein
MADWFLILFKQLMVKLSQILLVFSLTLREGFFRSIALRNEEALQDTLRLLTLWFKYGADSEVSHAIATGSTTVEVDTWLVVIPQVPMFDKTCKTSPNIQLDHCKNSNPTHQY